MVAPDSSNHLNKCFHEFSPLVCHALQPAESECSVETASSRAARTWTARGFAFACRTPTAAPAPAAGSGADARRVSLVSLQNQQKWICSTFVLNAVFSIASLLRRHVRTGLQVQLQLPERRSLQPVRWLPVSIRVEGTPLSETRYHRSQTLTKLRWKIQEMVSPLMLLFLWISLSDWAPQILDLEGNLERNLNSSPKIYCSATGNPLPSHNSIELRKPDGSVVEVESHSLFMWRFSVHITRCRRLYKSVRARKVGSLYIKDYVSL